MGMDIDTHGHTRTYNCMYDQPVCNAVGMYVYVCTTCGASTTEGHTGEFVLHNGLNG